MFSGYSLALKAGVVLAVLAAVSGIVTWLMYRGAQRNEAVHVAMQLEQTQQTISQVIAAQVLSNDTVTKAVDREQAAQKIIIRYKDEVNKYASKDSCTLSPEFVAVYNSLSRLRIEGDYSLSAADSIARELIQSSVQRVQDVAILRSKLADEEYAGTLTRQLEAMIDWETKRYALEKRYYDESAQ